MTSRIPEGGIKFPPREVHFLKGKLDFPEEKSSLWAGKVSAKFPHLKVGSGLPP